MTLHQWVDGKPLPGNSPSQVQLNGQLFFDPSEIGNISLQTAPVACQKILVAFKYSNIYLLNSNF